MLPLLLRRAASSWLMVAGAPRPAVGERGQAPAVALPRRTAAGADARRRQRRVRGHGAVGQPDRLGHGPGGAPGGERELPGHPAGAVLSFPDFWKKHWIGAQRTRYRRGRVSFVRELMGERPSGDILRRRRWEVQMHIGSALLAIWLFIGAISPAPPAQSPGPAAPTPPSPR